MERALILNCGGERLCGILHIPDQPANRGVVMIVGGPQYRVGSHRQFVLTARALAEDGISVLRFDHRGIGDSEGDTRTFDELGDDIGAAVSTLLSQCPHVRDVVVWGLCDAASAVALVAHRNHRISGVVLLNPWVRDEKTKARTYLKHYYPHRLVSPSLWGKVLGGRFEFRRSLRAFVSTAIEALKAGSSRGEASADGLAISAYRGPLYERMAEGLRSFNGGVLILLAGKDLTAKEFSEVSTDPVWSSILSDRRVVQRTLPNADHTFRSRSDLDEAARWTSEWIRQDLAVVSIDD